MKRSIRRMAFVASLTLGGLVAAEPAIAACEQRDFVCDAKTVCIRFVGVGADVAAGADWFPRPPRPFVPRPRTPRPHP